MCNVQKDILPDILAPLYQPFCAFLPAVTSSFTEVSGPVQGFLLIVKYTVQYYILKAKLLHFISGRILICLDHQKSEARKHTTLD